MKVYYKVPFIASGGFPIDYHRVDTVVLNNVPNDIREIYINMYTIQIDTDTVNENSRLVAFLPLDVEHTVKQNEAVIQAYPSPAGDLVQFKVNHAATKANDLTLVVTNNMGQVVKTLTPNSTGQLQWSTGNAVAGLYVYRLYNKDSLLGAGKVLISK